MLTIDERESRLKNLPNLTDLDLVDQVDEHVGFIKEFLDGFCLVEDIGWIGVEANNRMDMVRPLLDELWERLKRKTVTIEKGDIED